VLPPELTIRLLSAVAVLLALRRKTLRPVVLATTLFSAPLRQPEAAVAAVAITMD
jgi:hypothetical protein